MDGIVDVHQALFAVHFNSSIEEEEKKKKMGEIIGTQFVKLVGILEQRLKDNTSQEFIVGDKLSIADFALVSAYNGLWMNGDRKEAFGPIIEGSATFDAYLKGLTKIFEDYLAKREPRPM